jgi:hypothetical protein
MIGATTLRPFALACLAMLSGCSLLSIKTPEVPLTAEEQEARLLTRDYAAHFASSLTQLTDAAAAAHPDPGIRTLTLRLKLNAVAEITRASTGLSPIASLLDTWAFAVQLQDFIDTGAGSTLLGSAQPDLSVGTRSLAEEADALGRRVAGAHYDRYRSFVRAYADRNPLQSVEFVRPSVLYAWTDEEHDSSPLHIQGTVAQSLSDVSDRLRIYSERVPDIGLWRVQLALDRAGFDDGTYRTAFSNINAQLERISRLADSSPELAREAIGDFRSSLLASSDRLESAWLQSLKSLHLEREALTADISREREATVADLDVERARFSADAKAITAQVLNTSWRELHSLVREALLLLILLTLLVLGLPFAAGYLVGRRRGRIDR